MISLSEATLYTSTQRGSTQSATHRSFHTLNFGQYQRIHRAPYQSLRALNDETLAAAASVEYVADEDTLIFLLPVIGGITYEIENVASAFVDAGERVVIPLAAQSKIKLSNPYREEAVNFIQAWFTPMPMLSPGDAHAEFDLSQNDQFQTLCSSSGINIHMIRCTARRDQVLEVAPTCSGLFVFLLEGAIEFENRLLEARDSLSLQPESLVAFEALSDNALVLLFEFYSV